MKYSLNSKIITHLTEPQRQKLTWLKLTHQFNFKLYFVWWPIIDRSNKIIFIELREHTSESEVRARDRRERSRHAFPMDKKVRKSTGRPGTGGYNRSVSDHPEGFQTFFPHLEGLSGTYPPISTSDKSHKNDHNNFPVRFIQICQKKLLSLLTIGIPGLGITKTWLPSHTGCEPYFGTIVSQYLFNPDIFRQLSAASLSEVLLTQFSLAERVGWLRPMRD